MINVKIRKKHGKIQVMLDAPRVLAETEIFKSYGLVALASISPIKKKWDDGRKVPAITHRDCKTVGPLNFDDKDYKNANYPAYGSLVVSGDQKVKDVSDHVTCRCIKCGEEIKLSAGYLETLLIVHDLCNYWEEIEDGLVLKNNSDDSSFLKLRMMMCRLPKRPIRKILDSLYDELND